MFAENTTDEVAANHRAIMVVDDNPMALNFFSLLLRKAGYYVFEAGSARMAMAYAKAGHRFDLLLTDFQMPEMNGLELAAWFRNRQPEISVLVVTGSPALAQIHGGFHPSFVCRAKTWNTKKLVGTVAAMLALRDERARDGGQARSARETKTIPFTFY